MDILLMQRDVAVATEGRLAVTSIASRLTVDLLDAMLDSTAAHRVRFPDAVSMTVVKPNVPLPDDATRAYLKQINLRPDVARESVVVIDVGGFWAAAVRGVLAGVALVSATAPRAAVSVADAVALLQPGLSAPEQLTLTRDVSAFRAQHLAMR